MKLFYEEDRGIPLSSQIFNGREPRIVLDESLIKYEGATFADRLVFADVEQREDGSIVFSAPTGIHPEVAVVFLSVSRVIGAKGPLRDSIRVSGEQVAVLYDRRASFDRGGGIRTSIRRLMLAMRPGARAQLFSHENVVRRQRANLAANSFNFPAVMQRSTFVTTVSYDGREVKIVEAAERKPADQALSTWKQPRHPFA